MSNKNLAAGTLLYRYYEGALEVLIIHPSGNYNRNKPWSIPKGLLDPGETLEEAARRETWEEAGVHPTELVELGSIQYKTKSKKVVHCFTGPAPPDAQPHCPTWETDCAEFVSVAEARQRLHPDQGTFLDLLETFLARNRSE